MSSTSGQSLRVGYAVAAGIYLLAVLNRTSLGVAGLLAERRFNIGPAQLSVFIFVQLGVYAVMQVPTGVLVDRYGPRRLLVVAALVLGSAQLVFAFVASYPAAIAARTLLGMGDALTYVSVLRFAGKHFARRRYPVLVALTSTAGNAGNVLATLPLAAVLHRVGWSAGFGTAAGISLISAIVVGAALPSASPRRHGVHGRAAWQVGARSLVRRTGDAWSLPGVRLGFWVLFASMSVNTSFAMLWGNSYLTRAVGFDASQSGSVLMYTVMLSAMAGPGFGWAIGRFPVLRVPLVITTCVGTMAAWVVAVTLFGVRPPVWYAVTLFLVMGLLSQACLAGFALARDYSPGRTLGTATGAVNVGGFTATVLITVGIGAMLGIQGASDAHTFRIAVLVAVAVQAFGVLRVLIWWRRVRAFALVEQSLGHLVPVSVVRHRWDLPGPAGDTVAARAGAAGHAR